MPLVKRIARKALPFLVSIGIGLGLIQLAETIETRQQEGSLAGFPTHAQAVAALNAGDLQSAYNLFALAATEFQDPRMRAIALYEAANVGWLGQIADYQTLVDLYKYALRHDPDLYEAGYNLEYLYWLRSEAPGAVPGERQSDGELPGEEEYVPTGDI